MEIGSIYKTEIEMTYSQYKKMCWALKRTKATVISVVVFVLVFAMSIAMFKSGDIGTAVFLLFTAIAYPISVFGIYTYAMHKSYYSQKIAKDRKITYEFHTDKLIVHTSIGQSEVKYDLLYRLIETKTNFYLMVGVNQSLAVDKEKCSLELIDFLKGIKKKYKYK